jgi:two-component system, LytTR family, sensor kinase
MQNPSIFDYILLITTCLIFAVVGLVILANFSSLFKQRIKNELVRKNVVAWLVIFCISNAMLPMSGGFFIMIEKFGWWGAIIGQLVSTTLCTLVIFNIVNAVAESKQLKKLSFVKHSLLILVTLIITTLLINVPLSYVLYGKNSPYLKYVFVNSVYLAGATGIVYAVIKYLNIERKRKFDEKELELSRLRELKAKAELDALHSKVNPHFLYNALNSIADLSITDGKKARKMTIALADLFRYSINYSNNNYTTVKDEVEMAEVYMQIEKIRFEDQLNYTTTVEDEVRHFLVPRFLLQPIVENAVKHGLKATGQMTEIQLQVKKHENGIELVVADNGPAFPEEITPGYGVKSVFDKLDLLFPEQYEIHFSNEPRKHVSILIHKLMKNEPAV